jgi:hypothetical protein
LHAWVLRIFLDLLEQTNGEKERGRREKERERERRGEEKKIERKGKTMIARKILKEKFPQYLIF